MEPHSSPNLGNQIKARPWLGFSAFFSWVLPGEGCWWAWLSLGRFLGMRWVFGAGNEGISELRAGYNPVLHWELPRRC